MISEIRQTGYSISIFDFWCAPPGLNICIKYWHFQLWNRKHVGLIIEIWLSYRRKTSL